MVLVALWPAGSPRLSAPSNNRVSLDFVFGLQALGLGLLYFSSFDSLLEILMSECGQGRLRVGAPILSELGF